MIALICIAVHPRVCGEHAARDAGCARESGSSPRLRGTLMGSIGNLFFIRFIPASAGNTKNRQVVSYANTVHPRVCGEHLHTVHCTTTTAGSSPRLRGTRWRQCLYCTQPRFIPASAGNTLPSKLVTEVSTVHPRVCGEHILNWTQTLIIYGSSPRLRGTHCSLRCRSCKLRFIPASAGNTYQE